MIDSSDDNLSAREVFHAELARQRERAGLSLTELSEATNYDGSYLFRLEKGDRLGSPEAVRALDRFYGTGGHLSALWRLAKQEARQRRYRGFFSLEAEATSIQNFSIGTVPGLLQTERYAEALFRTVVVDDDDLRARQVLFRINRQQRLTGPKPLRFRALLDESVIRRPTEDPAVWTEQLEHLIKVTEQPNITLQVVPLRAGVHDLLGGPLALLWLPKGRTVAYVEGSWGGQLVEEPDEVESLRLSYDLLRDSALSPSESLEHLKATLEDHTSCRTPEQT
jgi:transcriptional regulator with XRE-family HTH domain